MSRQLYLPDQVAQMKLVGFIFDEKMTLKPMIDHVASKARKKLNAICRLRRHLDAKNLEQMCKAFMSSYNVMSVGGTMSS